MATKIPDFITGPFYIESLILGFIVYYIVAPPHKIFFLFISGCFFLYYKER